MPATLEYVEASVANAPQSCEDGGRIVLPGRFMDEEDTVASRGGPARGTLAGIALGAALWAAIVLPVIRY